MDVLAGRTSSTSLPADGDLQRRQEEYWRETLADAPEPLELPADRPRPARPDHAGAFVRLELDEEAAAGLRALGGRHRATLSTVLLAGWAAVLGRLSGQTDLVIGASTANRGSREVEGLIGRFVNPLPVRVDLSGSPTAAELLGRVEARVQGALRNQDLPFERVMELVQPDGAAASATPLFRAAFAWRDAPGSGPELPGLEPGAAAVSEPRATAGLDLFLDLREEGGGIAGEVVFATALFERETVERYAGYLRRMLAGMAADETRPLDRLTLLSDEERRRVVEEWNRTEAPYPESYIHERFEAQAERTSDEVAVVYEDRELTYGELNGRANRLAHHLRGLGVGPDARVAICVERGFELVVAVLGVLKSGGAYLPLDPGYPRERLLDMVEDSAPVVLLTHSSLAGRLAGLDLPLLALDEDEAWWGSQSDANPERAALTPEHLTYVIYTSGSTGRPKGVEMTHRGASNLLHWYLGATRISERDSVLIVTSFSFHLTQRNLLAPLFVGGRVHLAREPFEPGRITAQIVASGITMMNLTPTGFQALVEADGGRAIGGLRIVVFGGEPLHPRQLAKVPEPRPQFLNPYGSTEATGITTHHFARADLSSYSSRSMPPGRPIANARIYVLDGAGEPVPVGVTGELYLGGAGVTRGYRRLPGQTAERFLPDPFGREPGARLYRTGDLGRWLPDGTIEFMGRGDAQVKVRGFRIELGEIEARLAEHPAVHEVAVVARDGEVGDPRLVAYYVADETGAAALRAHLAERLPEYMIPAAFVHMDALPVNPNGKLDRKVLPAPEYASEDENYVAPRTPVEEVLAGIWAEVLGVARVGGRDPFFELGGHSLLATRVVSRVREVFGVELPLRALFEGPSVAEMASAVEEMRRAELPVLPPVVPVERTGAPPLSFAQERLWFLDQLEPGSAFYNLPAALRLTGALDAAVLERSLGEIVRRHEALRTTFRERDGTPLQMIAPFGGFALLMEDLSHLPEETREAEVRREASEGAARPFDLSAGPLFRAALLRLGAEDHVLLLSMHHIVSDGWSMGVLYRELSALYAAYRESRESPLPELAVQYADYAVWQREQLEGEALDRQLAYWRERLAGAPALLELPTDRPRPAAQSFRGANQRVQLPPEVLERLRALGRQEGATLYMVVLSAFQALLSRYSGSEDVVVGSPIAGRGRSEVEALIGFFVNTLVLRTDLSGDPSFRALLGRVREVTLGAYEHQEVPFERLVAELQPDRSLSYSPLFQVAFTLDNAGDTGAGLAGLSVRGVETELQVAKSDLSLGLAVGAGGLRGVLTYSTDLWEAATMRRLVGHFTRLVEQAAADPDVRISRVTLLDETERRQVVEEWNRTSAEYRAGACIHELVAAQAARTPDAVAVVQDDRSLTYAELNARANRLAHHLRALGVGPEARVAVCAERSAETIVAVLGVLKAGGAYVPLDPEYPADRLLHMLRDSAPAMLLAQGPLAGRFGGSDVPVVVLDDNSAWASQPRTNPGRGELLPEGLAYVIYTSGSTGTPKGVMGRHRGVVNLLAWSDRVWDLGPGDAVLQRTSFSFDVSVREMFAPLVAGARLIVARPGGQRDVDYLVETIRRQEVTTMYHPPAMMQALLEHPELERCSTLRCLASGGEALPAGLVRELHRRLPNVRLYHEYGPTEATVTSTVWSCAPDESVPGASIGAPVSNTRIYLLDKAGEPVPVGGPGELYVGGAGVARGYRGRPGATAERFVPDALGGEPGARLYRTGDLGCWLPDGTVEFLGRMDRQVKVRGFRIEPGEIEGAIRRSGGVADCVVVVREDAPGEKRLVAYVVGDVEAGGLRERLRRELPEHMVPAAFVPLERLPLTPNGKLDREALPAPERGTGEAEYVGPRTEVEEVLAGTWAEVLRLERVGVEDNLFDVGGHSLLATRVVSRIRELFGVELPVRAIFEGPTVAELAGRVQALRRAELPVLPPVVPVERTAPLPLSFAQERLWFLHQMEPEDAGYNMSWPGRLRGCLDARALERALGEMVRRHEALRTTFAEADGSPVQVIAPFGGFALSVEDLSGLSETDREAAVGWRAGEEAVRPFDLSAGPLFRAALLRLGAEDHVLLLTMHHIVSDGWSMGVLFRELFTLYESFSRPAGEEPASPLPSLPPLAVQYADFAVWQRGWLRGEVLRRQLDWWRERLGGAPPALELPTDRPRPAVASSRGASHGFRLPAEITRGLRALARREGATLYMVTHAALDLLLSRWSGQEDLVVGSPIAGRTQVETEGLIGFFVNTLALRIDLSGDPSFQVLLGRVRETALGAYAHQELPFERLVEEIAPERGLSHTPLFQVMFALQNANSAQVPATSGLRLEPFGGEVRTVRFDLELDLREVGEELVGSLRFRTGLFDAATIERFAAQYRVVLAAIGASPEERLSRLAILPPEEARRLLAYGSGSAREDVGGLPVHHLFAARAARTPGATAVRFEGESLSYAELDAYADRLARELRSRGVQAGTTVAVCLARGTGSAVAPLAVWKAGGVYLPLDPSYPAERLSFLLRDSGASHVLTESGVAGVLPAHEAEVVRMDGPSLPPASLPVAGEGERDPASEPGGNDLAYLIYTSGSTGTPKAVMVEHGQLAHTLSGALEVLGLGADDVVPALASVAFDISLLELIAPLLAGAALRVVPSALVRDAEALVDALADVTVLHAVPALMRQVVEAVRGGRTLPGIRLLLVGGDSVPPGLLEDMRELFPAARTRVLYGPTEAAIICATYAVPAEGAVAGHPLGRPLPGVRLAVRGPRGEMAPVGVPGEVWISGGGVARGYLGRPELSAEKFVGAGTERAYRTGDRARWRADDVLEFLGRADEQVKVRGFRIEPGEVAAALREHPGVREAVVLAREDAPGDRRLVAYVVPSADGFESAGGTEQVAEWETLFDDTYAQDEGEQDPTLQLKGWNSSYTGEPIPREEMRAWVEHTAERILALRPERVLEVGCGTGLLLFRVAPHTRAYHGTDFSGVALEHIRRHSAGLPQVSLAEREGDRLDDYAGAGFDVVVVNSVAQYFPNLDYLLRVLDGAAAALRPGGRIFLGDVRSLPLAGAFHASVELARAPEDLSIERLRDRVRRGVAEEQELLLDPALFESVRARMPQLGRVEVQVKRGEYDNEVSRFRYDVVLHLDVAAAAAPSPVVREWGGEDVDGLRALAEGSASALLVRGLPDARVREHVRALELISSDRGAATAGEVRALANAGAGDGIPPEALFALADELARGIEVRPGAPGTLDVLFHPAADVARFPVAVDAERPWESYANDPQWGRRMRALVPALRESARARLPEYMVPSAFVVLESFPVTPNGKVDRGALPAPDTLGSRGGAYVAPRAPAEERMAAIWAEVLGAERVGAEDHFFELGGHSLLATQLVSRVREAFGAELPLRAVFEAPTLAELVRRVEALRAGTPGDAGAPPLVPVPRDGAPLPLSFAQQRLWFIDQLEPGSTAYHMPSVLRLHGTLDPRVLERALGEVVRRHEALRTTFGESEGVPFQVVHPAGAAPLEVTDLSHLAAEERGAEARRLIREEVRCPFDLRAGPLFRAALLRLGEEEHVLVLAMHHIVSDGWSMGVLTREMGALYDAFRRGEASPLPEPPVQYADYAAWQRRWVAGDVLREQARYWKTALSGAPELLDLPTDRARPARQDYAGATVAIDLGEELSAGLKALSQRHGTTLFMTLLAGWAAVLGRLSGQEDVVVGTPSANRGRREIEGLVGFFVNTLPLRIELGGSPSVSDVLGRVKQRALEAQANQDIPFEQVVELVQPARSMAYAPLFQVMFSWQGASEGRAELPGLRAEGVGLAGAASEVPARFDLSLSLGEAGGRIVGSVEYATSLFERATVERHLAYLRRALEAIVADDRQAVDALPLLPESERRLVLEEWNRTEAAYPRGLCFHELFEAQARRTPGAVALISGDLSLTYAELNARANRLARRLAALGAGPERIVALALERSVEMVVALLAVTKAGAAFLPVDPAYPAERRRWMLERSAAPLVLTTSVLAADLPVTRAAVVALDGIEAEIEGEDDGDLSVDVDVENAAYVIFTSGSTGRPKGVVVPHRGIGNLAAAQREAFGVEPDGRVLQFASFSFDAAVAEVAHTLLCGAALVMARPGQAGPELLALMGDEAVTVATLPPALLATLPADDLPALRTIVSAGEVVSADVVARWGEGRRFVNAYGPTETTVCATVSIDPPTSGRPPIGRPIANVRAYVLDARMQPVPVGVPGELYVGGVGVARGYLGQPAETAERFVPDPFGGEPGARLYRTGDLGRWCPDGAIEFVGRNDFQVKIRGFRVELGEIEARLLEHPGVREAAVLAREDAAGDRRLAAYIVGPDSVAVDALRAHLSERLPGHMVPAAYVHLDALPLTPNGKMDRKALPSPEGDAYARRGYEAPVGETERALAEIWSELLRVERAGRWDHFFELGGHSLLAVRVISRVRQVLGAEVRIADLFERPVLADLARAIDDAARTALPPIEPADRSAPLPLSFAQQRLWFLERMGDLGSTYHIPTRLRLGGELDRAALSRALDAIVARHEALRTTFVEVEGEPVQRIAEESRFHLVEHDLGDSPNAAAELRRLAVEEAGAPFDLEHGPLIRGRLVRLSADDHVLLLTMHHVISDGWSMGVLTRELGTLYDAFRRGEPDLLPPLPVQYADYAAWQRQWVAGEVLREQAEYWKAALSGAPELLELPTDRPRPARKDHAGAAVGIDLGEELTAGLKALSQRRGTTLFMTLLAGWAAVLGRLSGQHDVVVGTPSANRGRAEIEGLIGFFVNTLALRIELGGSPSVSDVLGRVKQRALEAQANQDIPFEQVVDLVQPARSMAHTPLFQVMFAWQSASEGRVELPGLRVGGVDAAPQAAAQFDLSLSLGEAGGRIIGNVIYATSLFERATVERHLAYLRRALEAIVADDLQPVDALPLLPESERRLVLEEWNRTEAAYPRGLCFHELFEAQARRTPDAVALISGDLSLTYAELNARANRLARRLVALGAAPEAIVALALERSVEMVVALLAVNKAGAAFLPVDPAYPAERRRWMMERSAARLVLTTSALAADLPETLATGVALDRVAAEIEGEDDGDLSVDVDAENAAYVIFTSGSTGRPKGVVVPHRGIGNLAAAQREAFGVEVGGRVLQFASFSFDAAVAEVAHTLFSGATLVMARPGQAGPELLALMGDEAVTVATLPPALLATLPADGLPALRTIVSAGEAVSADVVARWGAGRRFVNAYGPTETTVCATVSLDPPTSGRPPIGRPIANVRAYVLDARMRPVPVGVPGELYVGGVGVARGYLGQPAETAERFVPDPFGGEPGARLYRTGDLGRWCPDGAIEFVGRNDFQVKIRGFRVELGEIEARLLEHPGVREAAVLAREDAPGDRRLVAYIVGPDSVAVDALRVHLSERLPGHMVPAAYVHLDALPLTPNGKVDRKALPSPEGDAYARRGYEAPVGETERALAEIWSELLRVERAGRWDHFFEMGGHSLLAVRVISRVRQVLGAEARIADLFERPVLADLARAIDEAARTALPPIEPADRSAPLPLSFAQQRLWFIDHLEPGSTAYHMPSALRLRGPLDPRVLERALGEVVRRHEALRTTFGETEGVPFQVVHPAGAARLERTDLSRLAPTEREAEARRLVREEVQRPFDLRRGPLLRTHLLRLGEEEHVLVLAMHHVVGDGWSMGVLFGEVATLYEAFARGRASPLPKLPVQYADFAAWQRACLAGEAMERQIAWWRERLEGAPPVLELPTDRARPAVPGTRTGRVFRTLPPETAQGVRALARREGATLYMVLLAVLDLLLARWSGQEDVVVGTPIANRTRWETEGLIGFFVNTLALRADVSGNPRVSELVGRVREATLGAYQHQDVPFERLVDALQVERSLSHTPLFRVMFSLDDGTGDPRPFGGLAVEPYPTGAFAAKFDLDVAVVEWQRGLRVGITYREELWDASTLERLAGAYALLLEGVAAEPGRRVLDIPLMTDAERERVLRECGATATGLPRPACVHELFQARAMERPHAPALTFQATTLTYRELNVRANRLAHRLRALGVGPETRVGIALERSAELIVAILAVLKAGGGYVPLDPSYPADRIAFILEDAGVPVLVTASHLVARLPAFAGAVLCIDADAEAIAAESGENPGVEAGPDSLAYVIYTSGSTGRPKGVQVTHANVARLFDATESWFGFAADDVWTLFHSCAFDFSVWEIWGALLYGGRLVVVPFLTTRSPEDLHRLLVGEGVTMLSQTPSAFKQLVQANLASGVGPSALRLRCVVFGGEALDPQSLRPWMERHGDARPRLVNMYGITETTVHVTYRVISRADLDRGGSPIGVPIRDLSLYVLDSRLEPVPPGLPGELFVGGAGVARGYLNRPELTAERFLRDPFSADPQARLYRTGDLARRRADGELEYLGRADQQVKIRGFRIELGEIEAALMELPGIRDAAVLVRDEAHREKQLVAYVVLHPGEAEDPSALRGALSARLPDHMVPAVFVVLPEMPLTSHGKLDRRALPAPGAGRTLRPAYASPASAPERLLQEVWQEVLGAERVGVLENFFAAGGDSIRAVQMVALLRKRGMKLTVRDLFEEPTIRGLAERSDEAAQAGKAPEGVPHHLADLPEEERARVRAVFPAPVQDVYPATGMQAVMLSEYAKDTARAGVYHPQQCHRLTDASLSTDALRHAIEQVVRRHAILRTVFTTGSDGTLLQVVRESPSVPIGYQDLRGLSPDEQERAFQARVAEDLDTPFDPFDPHGSLMRFVILHREDHVADLLMSAHHAIEDGWGNVHFVGTLFEAYADVRDGRPVSAAPVPNTYREFVALEAEILASDQARTFWRDRMRRRQVSSRWPAPRGGTGESPRECRVVREVKPELTAALRETASREGVALKALYLSAFLDLVATLSGGEDACAGVVWNGRSERLSDPLTALGLFWNLLPVARPGTASGGAAGRAVAVHQDLLQADLFGRYPLAEIMADRGGREPFFSTFNFLHFRNWSGRDAAVRGGRVEPVYGLDRLHLPFNLAVSLAPRGEGAGLRVEYDDRFFSRVDVAAALESYLLRLLAVADVSPSSSNHPRHMASQA